MINQESELTLEQQKQVIIWNQLINNYDDRSEDCFSPEKIQELLKQIQQFVNTGLPESAYEHIKVITDAIYEASLVLAEPAESENHREHLKKASHLIYIAIKHLCH